MDFAKVLVPSSLLHMRTTLWHKVPRATPATLKPSPDMSFQRISPIRAHHLLRNLCLQTLQFLRGTHKFTTHFWSNWEWFIVVYCWNYMDLPQKDTEGFLFIRLGCLFVYYSNVFEEVEFTTEN